MSRPTPLPEDAGIDFALSVPLLVPRFLAVLLLPEDRLPLPAEVLDRLPVFFFLAAICFPHKSVIVVKDLRNLASLVFRDEE